MDVRLTWMDCDEAGDYDVPNVISPRDLVSRPDNMDETGIATNHENHFCMKVVANFTSLFYLIAQSVLLTIEVLCLLTHNMP